MFNISLFNNKIMKNISRSILGKASFYIIVAGREMSGLNLKKATYRFISNISNKCEKIIAVSHCHILQMI